MLDHNRMTPILITHYECFLDDHDASRYGRRIAQRYSEGTLHRLAKYGDRTRRRAAILALGLLGDYNSNHVMGNALVDKDRGVRMFAEDGIRSIWHRAGNPQQRQRLQLILQLNTSKQSDKVLAITTELLEQAPWFAEVWNQRAIAYFRLRQYTDSIRDCRQALEINPYHFGAASGMGQCYAYLDDRISALECFRRALRLNPNLESVRMKVISLQRALKES